MPNGEERSGREVRLLALVIVVAVAGLLVLARFRFPGAEIVTVTPSPSPLERLASKPAFQELTDTVADTGGRLMPLFDSAAFDRPAERPARKGTPPAVVAPPRFVPALRVQPTVLLAYAPPGLRLRPQAGGVAQARVDSRREIALITVPAPVPATRGGADVVDLSAGVTNFDGWTYVLAAEAGATGPTARPVFVPRVDAVPDERWGVPLLRIGGDPQVGAGAFLFTLDGHLIGLSVPQDGGVAIVPAGLLNDVINAAAEKK